MGDWGNDDGRGGELSTPDVVGGILELIIQRLRRKLGKRSSLAPASSVKCRLELKTPWVCESRDSGREALLEWHTTDSFASVDAISRERFCVKSRPPGMLDGVTSDLESECNP